MEQLGIDLEVYKEAYNIISDNDAINKIKQGKLSSPSFTLKETDEAYVIEIDPNKFGIKKIDNAPAVIVIDEATHLSNLELQIISQFAKINDSRLILLGDGKQKGWGGIGNNIDREQCFTVRAPNLGISLRDDNIQHQFNLRILESLIEQLSNLDKEDPQYEQKFSTIKELIHRIQFKVYNQDEINGEQILTSLTQPYVNKLHGTVGYVGRQPSATLDLLNKSGLEVTILPEIDIQGQEFDYVVIDKDFSIPTKQSSALGTLNFLRDLYTMISRGRKGSIIIDPSGKLKEAIGENKVEFTKAQAPKIVEYADKFRQEKLDILDKILGEKQEQQNQEETSADTTEIILDKDFNVDNLDFNNNYYVIWQVPFAQAGNIQQVGIVDPKSLEGNVLFATKDLINQVITTQKEGKGYNGADAIVLMQFPKEIFGTGVNDINTITSKIEQIDNVNNIPTKYINSIIHTIPIDTKEDIKTDPNDIIQPPTPTELDIKEQAIDKDDLPSTAEDVGSDASSNPILCFGQATFTGMKVESRNGKQIWINPSQHEYSDMVSMQNPEMQAILGTARRDNQGRLLAPNGSVSNLSEQQWAYVRTRDFKSWFGDWENDPENSSKMIDENGEPRVFYHGNPTKDKITRFDQSRIGTSHQERAIKGFWFTPNKEYARYQYAESNITGTIGEVVPVFLNIRNLHKENQKGVRREEVLDDQGRVIGETWVADESINDATYLLDTKGERIGQVNGLAVYNIGELTFGRPIRITATTYRGQQGIVDIENEAKLSGSIHTKGIHIITGFLGNQFAQEFPLSLSCNICFEQSYGPIDGDSASSAELYAILSSLSERPIKQNIAVTGSINQFGEIQPIGGVNEKIEGFFKVCEQRGLSGDEGVIIPNQNTKELLLASEVIEAVKNNKFHIYAINHVWEGVEIIMGTEKEKVISEVQEKLRKYNV